MPSVFLEDVKCIHWRGAKIPRSRASSQIRSAYLDAQVASVFLARKARIVTYYLNSIGDFSKATINLTALSTSLISTISDGEWT
jgi:hypothetical protein